MPRRSILKNTSPVNKTFIGSEIEQDNSYSCVSWLLPIVIALAVGWVALKYLSGSSLCSSCTKRKSVEQPLPDAALTGGDVAPNRRRPLPMYNASQRPRHAQQPYIGQDLAQGPFDSRAVPQYDTRGPLQPFTPTRSPSYQDALLENLSRKPR